MVGLLGEIGGGRGHGVENAHDYTCDAELQSVYAVGVCVCMMGGGG